MIVVINVFLCNAVRMMQRKDRDMIETFPP